MTTPVTLATHSGTFHADDIFAYAILQAAHGGSAQLVRSRDQATLDQADIVFDVGGSCDPSRHRYDHHMRDRPLRGSGEPFSSAGLVWQDFGRRAIDALLDGSVPGDTDRHAAIDDVWTRLDQGLIRDVDLMDNGAMAPVPGHFSSLLEAFNPSFVETERDETQAFLAASQLAHQVLCRAIAQALAAHLAADTVKRASQSGDDPRIIVLERRVPWEDAIFDLGLDQALYVVRPAGTGWTCSAVPPERGSFAQRLPLPDAWGGLRDDDLVRISGVADAGFCHPARFVCGAKSRDGTIALAQKAVALATA